MVSRPRTIVSLLLLPLAIVASCDKVPLLAPTGTVINLFPATTSVSLNSEVTIVATVIENGVATGGTGGPGGGGTTSRSGNGTPVQNGTVISFTTTIGRIEPADARTTNGQVNVRLITGNVSGTATITAYSGGASSQTTLKVGTAAVKTVVLTTSPATLGASGGSVLVTGTALDEGGSPVGGVQLIFTADKGTLSPSTTTTDASGNATTTLTTTTTSKIKAAAGSVTSNEATVTVNPFANASFTATPTTTSVGTPVTFSLTLSKDVGVSSARIEYGDGARDDFGPFANDLTVSHSYGAPGVYQAKATATDTAGGSSSLQTTITVGSLLVTLTASDTTPSIGQSVIFTVSFPGTAPPIDHFTWTFDDGTPPFTGTSASVPHTFTTVGSKNVRVEVFAVGGGKVGSASAQVVVH